MHTDARLGASKRPRGDRAETRRGRPATVDKEHLLDVAEECFAARGFAGTTTRELAREASCNLALISYHFGGKRELYQAVLVRYFKRMRDAILASRKASRVDEKELLRQWPEFADVDIARFSAALFSYIDSAFSHSHMHKVMCREMMTGGYRATQAPSRNDTRTHDLFVEMLAELAKKGKLRAKADTRNELDFIILSLVGPVVYSCVAAPMLEAVYGFRRNVRQARSLAVFLTRLLVLPPART